MSTSIPLPPPLMRIGFASGGIALLWFGLSQISIAGLVLMLIGLAVAVSALTGPPPGLRAVRLPRNLMHVTSSHRGVS
jgi:hypothetical protein